MGSRAGGITSDRFAAAAGTTDASVLSRRRLWPVVAAAVVLLGSAASVIAGLTVAREDREQSRRTFEADSLAIASTLQLALQHEDDLVVNASAFLTQNPDASNETFAEWAGVAQVLPRYPELQALGFAVLVPADGLAAYAEMVTADPMTQLAPGATFQVLPPGDRPFYCFPRLGFARSGPNETPPGYDFCAGADPAVLDARDSGRGSYSPLDMGGGVTWFTVQTPIYRRDVAVDTVADRRAAFIGWAGVSLDPTVIIDRALVDHPDMAVALRFGEATFTSSVGAAATATHSIDLENGWTLQTFGQLTAGGLFDNWTASGLMAFGILVSMLLGLVVLLLSTGRARALGMVAERTDELRHQALHDALTGLPNRALIMDRIERLQARDRRNGTAGATLFFDLDGFKSVNDTLGHDAGDRLLQTVAERLSTALRDVDTIGRMGGDEFVILIEGGTPGAAPDLVAERVLEVISQPVVLAGAATPLVVTASIGIAMNQATSTPLDALRDADMALYEAKDGGKNRYEVFRPEMETTIRHRYELELDLRAASNDQFHLVYQPIYHLDDLSIVGVEALIRWQHPTIGLIQPDDFVPLLESSGVIVDVGRWVLLEACTQMAAWHATGSQLTLSVNVSGRQLDQDVIVDDVRNALTVSGLTPTALTIEVTESALTRDIDSAARRLRELKDLGTQIAIDDFGTGYSSLAYLQRLPVDCLKIDRTFTEALTRSADSDALVHTLVQLGKDLGLKILAEGVETTDQIDHLRGEHVDEAQGFLLARPLSPARFEALMLDPSRRVEPTS